MKALVVYYSRSGHTRKVGETIADMLACDKEEIIDTAWRSGPIGFLRSGYQNKKKSFTKIEALKRDVSKYDLVIIGTPVWAGTASVPMRTFVHRHKDDFNNVAFFSVHGGEDIQDEFREMEALCGKKPVCLLSFSQKEVNNQGYVTGAEKFVKDIKNLKGI
ncbi:MAG: NAD(P)H-dependent oxidoreductase [Theionarchaea archaeon]|nr:NAD(P)H-dependent oxidoreductase [Theionarchaea archaeon]MBU7021750.1 NAD(P)H-dependent oxidoreductase [Theionarchaea archaeon]MBU7034508.1 NAD(P)H-dependent oxidoreductase [Theionarchaea archaeon]